jgi:TolA-binding protein
VKATYWLAEASFRQSNFDEAVEQFDFVRKHFEEMKPEIHPWIWLRAAQSLGQLEQWQEAKRVADEGVDRFGSFPLTHEFNFLQARGLEDSGRLSDAQKVYQQVIDSKEGGDSETAAIAQWLIGEIYFHQENYAQAIKAYYLVDSQFAYEQWRSAALLQAGKCQENLENFAHAQRLYTRLIEQFPESSHRQSAEDRIKRLKQFQQANFNTKSSATKKTNPIQIENE